MTGSHLALRMNCNFVSTFYEGPRIITRKVSQSSPSFLRPHYRGLRILLELNLRQNYLEPITPQIIFYKPFNMAENLFIEDPSEWLIARHGKTLVKIYEGTKKDIRVNLAEMQRIALRKLQCRLAKHAVDISIKKNIAGDWDEDLQKYSKYSAIGFLKPILRFLTLTTPT